MVAPVRILVVDDEEQIAQLLAGVLRGQGHECEFVDGHRRRTPDHGCTTEQTGAYDTPADALLVPYARDLAPVNHFAVRRRMLRKLTTSP